MRRVILNRLKAKAEEQLAEEQGNFRLSQSTVEQIFNNAVITEKHVQQQSDMLHNFINVKLRRRLTESGMQACSRL